MGRHCHNSYPGTSKFFGLDLTAFGFRNEGIALQSVDTSQQVFIQTIGSTVFRELDLGSLKGSWIALQFDTVSQASWIALQFDTVSQASWIALQFQWVFQGFWINSFLRIGFGFFGFWIVGFFRIGDLVFLLDFGSYLFLDLDVAWFFGGYRLISFADTKM